jgi:hypothetical protein
MLSTDNMLSDDMLSADGILYMLLVDNLLSVFKMLLVDNILSADNMMLSDHLLT